MSVSPDFLPSELAPSAHPDDVTTKLTLILGGADDFTDLTDHCNDPTLSLAERRRGDVVLLARQIMNAAQTDSTVRQYPEVIAGLRRRIL